MLYLNKERETQLKTFVDNLPACLYEFLWIEAIIFPHGKLAFFFVKLQIALCEAAFEKLLIVFILLIFLHISLSVGRLYRRHLVPLIFFRMWGWMRKGHAVVTGTLGAPPVAPGPNSPPGHFFFRFSLASNVSAGMV